MSYLEKYSDEELLQIFGSDVEAEIRARGYRYGWYKPTEYAGVIYILVNKAFPNLVKIGYADNVEKRVKSFNRNSGLPDKYHVYATYKVKKRLEDLKLHKLIDSLNSDLRYVQNREFYEMSPEKAYEILSAIAQINGDEDLLIKNPLNDEIDVKPNLEQNKIKGIYFEKGSESVSCKSWVDFEEEICNKIIKEYGYEEFTKFILNPDNKKLHTKKKNYFGTTDDKMISFREIRDGLYMNTNNSADAVRRICSEFVKQFPDAKYKILYN